VSDADVTLSITPPRQREACVLCQRALVNPDDALLVSLWMAYAPWAADPYTEIARILARQAPELIVEEVRRHFRKHRPEQPNPPLRLAKARAQELIGQLSARDWELIRFVSQGWLVREAHIREWFFEPTSGSVAAARANGNRRLNALRHHCVLYRRELDGAANKLGEGRLVYGLGRTGAKLLDLADENEGKSRAYLKSRDDVSTYRLNHDLGVVDVALELHRSGKAGTELLGRACRAEVKPHNLHTARSLAFDYQTPQYMSEFGKLVPGAHHTLVSDGLSVIGVRPTDTPDQSIACPYLLEFDTGQRKLFPVAEQMFAYLALNQSRSVQKRFPELDVEGYQVPLVVVTKSAKGTSGAKRRTSLIRTLHNLVEKRNYKLHAPIYIALRDEVAELGVNAPVVSVWDDQPRTLLEAVAHQARPLIASKRIDADTVLDIDLTAAKPRQATTEALSATEREAQEAVAEKELEEIEARQREHERYEAERLRRLDELQGEISAGGAS
jgi:hypothetical protein